MRDKPENWQKILAQGFPSAQELLKYLMLAPSYGSNAAESSFKTRVPRGYVERMNKGDPNDPLLLQVLAVAQELDPVEGFTQDPLDEAQQNPHPGLIHKYHGRVLLTLTGTCAIHCRYCFRRHFPYEKNNPGRLGWEKTFDYIRQEQSIQEVILSGGDPFLATDTTLKWMLSSLEAIPHIKTVRFHTRIPIVLPERITQELLDIFDRVSLHKVLVLHSNHAQELDDSSEQAIHSLGKIGFKLLNQSVLLKGVNDQVDILVQLSERLFDIGVFPYYLHVLDKVLGTSHFDIPLSTAQNIYQQLQSRLPGYLVPRLVAEYPHQANKVLVNGGKWIEPVKKA